MPERTVLIEAEERLLDIVDTADHAHTRDQSPHAWILITKNDVPPLRAALKLVRTELSKTGGA